MHTAYSGGAIHGTLKQCCHGFSCTLFPPDYMLCLERTVPWCLSFTWTDVLRQDFMNAAVTALRRAALRGGKKLSSEKRGGATASQAWLREEERSERGYYRPVPTLHPSQLDWTVDCRAYLEYHFYVSASQCWALKGDCPAASLFAPYAGYMTS